MMFQSPFLTPGVAKEINRGCFAAGNRPRMTSLHLPISSSALACARAFVGHRVVSVFHSRGGDFLLPSVLLRLPLPAAGVDVESADHAALLSSGMTFSMWLARLSSNVSSSAARLSSFQRAMRLAGLRPDRHGPPCRDSAPTRPSSSRWFPRPAWSI